MATDAKPFFTQFYEEGACGHQKITVDDNHCGLCLKEYQPIEEWLQCPICKISSSIATVFMIDNKRWNHKLVI